MRIKMTKDYLNYKAGQILILDKSTAKRLIRAGKAILTKDMTQMDYKVKHGNFA